MWIVLLTCETHLVYTVRAPVRGPTRAIEGLHRAGVESRSLAEDFDTSHGHRQAPARDGVRLQRVVAEFDQGALGRGPKAVPPADGPA